MNPSAQEFVPHKVNLPRSILQPPTPVACTKLSASAVPFVPLNAVSSAAHPKSPHYVDPAEISTASSKPQSPEVASAGLKIIVPSSGGGSPTNAHEKANEPSSSFLQKTSSSAIVSGMDEEFPPATAVDWADSKLPSIFGCHNTSAMATSSPMKFNSSWELYADDHSTTTTPLQSGSTATTMAFEPILISAVGDVEAFWRLWRHTPPPSSCPSPFTYSFFRKDVKPEWEHPRNRKGGTISVVIFDRDRPGLNDKQVLDDAFMATLLGCVGESFTECTSTFNGVMLKVRQNKPVAMQIWTAHSEVSKLKAFANSLRDTLSRVMGGSKPLQKLEFYSHHQKQAANNSLAARMRSKPKITPDYVI